MKARLDPQYMPCYAEGDWESVVSFFQKFLRKERDRARVVANAERAKALNGDDTARIQLFDMGVIKVWKGVKTKPGYAKLGISDPYSDPDNLRNTLHREIGDNVYLSVPATKKLFEKTYGRSGANKQKAARNPRYPIIIRSKYAGVAVWHLATTPPPTRTSQVMNSQTRGAYFLKLYGGKIDGLTVTDVGHKILEVAGRDADPGCDEVTFAEKEFHDMRNTNGALYFERESKLWYDATSAEPIKRKLATSFKYDVTFYRNLEEFIYLDGDVSDLYGFYRAAELSNKNINHEFQSALQNGDVIEIGGSYIGADAHSKLGTEDNKDSEKEKAEAESKSQEAARLVIEEAKAKAKAAREQRESDIKNFTFDEAKNALSHGVWGNDQFKAWIDCHEKKVKEIEEKNKEKQRKADKRKADMERIFLLKEMRVDRSCSEEEADTAALALSRLNDRLDAENKLAAERVTANHN
jgi:hypothetical protein